MRLPRSICVLAICISSLGDAAHSEDLFQVEAAGGGTLITVSGNSLPDLLDSIGDVSGQFEALQGQAFVASVAYGGIQSAIVVEYDPGAGPNSATIVITSLLGTDAAELPVFDEANGDLGQQLEDYFLKNGADLIAQFQRAVATQSAVGLVSGNPVSAVGRLLGYQERRFGIGRIRFRNDTTQHSTSAADFQLMLSEEESAAIDSPPTSGLGVTTAVSVTGYGLNAGGYTGTSATVEPSLAVDFGETASVVFGLPFGWTEWQGSNSWTLGFQLDVPITLVHHQGDRPDGNDDSGSPDVRWTVVPGGGALGAFSYELIQGGLLWNAGVLSNLEIYDERHSFAFTQQYLHMDSIRLEYKDYIIDYGTTQDAIQLGIRYAYQLGGNCALYAGTSWSRMLDGNAYVPDWFTPQAGIAWTFGNGGIISLGFEGQFGQNDWQSYGGQLTFVIPF